jgi:5-methylcytosine-specific restriction endonuclease McrA
VAALERGGHVQISFEQLSDEELDLSAINTAEQSRKITLRLLQHLNEIERRHLYSKFSVSSLHAYCVIRLKMDEAAAGRHVSAARLLREVPVIQEKIASGSMSLTSVAQAGVFLRREAHAGHAFAREEKRELVMSLENKSTREVDRMLIARSSTPHIHLKEKVTVKTEQMIEVRLHFDQDTMAAIQRLKEVWSHAMPNATIAEILTRAATEAVVKHDPLEKIKRAEKRKATPAPEWQREPKSGAVRGSNSESVERIKNRKRTASIRRAIWKRDASQCTFVDAKTGEQCRAKHFVEEDHIVPRAIGGEYSLENIRLRCRAHNQRHAIDCFGAQKMRVHINSMH